MFKFMLVLLIAQTGCATGFKIYGDVGPEFEPYVNRFMEVTGINFIFADIYFEEQTGNVIGVCKSKGAYRAIEIDPEWWNEADDWGREALMFHELSHCILDQDHRNFTLDDGCAGSIMDEYHMGSWCYEKHYDHYISEFVRW